MRYHRQYHFVLYCDFKLNVSHLDLLLFLLQSSPDILVYAPFLGAITFLANYDPGVAAFAGDALISIAKVWWCPRTTDCPATSIHRVPASPLQRETPTVFIEQNT
jgi:hypothetical protein